MTQVQHLCKKALVAGGAGFLGSHLIDRLLSDGHHVICLDNLSTGSRDNILRYLGNPQFEMIDHDVCDTISVDADEIWNFACPASPPCYQNDPIQTTRTSVLGALNLLELARKLDCPIFQASTSEVYGNPEKHPQNESYWGHVNPIGPRACYDEGKRCAETLFFDYRRKHGLKVRVARLFNTFGPRMQPDDGRVISNFVVQALLDQNITLFGDGTQTRSFCYVSDTIDACMRLMRTGSDVVGPVNIGNPVEMTIRDIADRIVAATGSRSQIVVYPLPQDDPRRRCPDITKARSLLGWEPVTEFGAGLDKTIAYFRRRLGLCEI